MHKIKFAELVASHHVPRKVADNISIYRALGFEVVDLFVGPQRKRFVVHKDLLTAQSDFFSKALTGSFKEAEENSIHLKEEDPAAVALLVAWLYLGILPGSESLAAPFAVFPSPQTTQMPVSEKGTFYPFAPTLLQDPHSSGLHGPYYQMESLNHICYQPHYGIFSQEELRLADYQLGRKSQIHDHMLAEVTAPTPTAPPSQPAVGGGLFGNLGNGSSLSAQLASQTPTQNMSSGLSGGGSRFGTLALQPSAPESTGTRLFGGTTSSSVFNRPAMQRTSSKVTQDNTQTNNQWPNLTPPGFSAQLNASLAPQHQVTLAAGYSSGAQISNSNPHNAASATQPSSSSGRASTSASIPPIQPPSSAQIHSLFGATSYPSSGGLFGPASTSQSKILFAGLSNSTTQSNGLFGSRVFGPSRPTSQTSSTASISSTSSTTSGRLFGGFAAPLVPQASHGFPYAFGIPPEMSHLITSLPPGAVMTTLHAHKPKPGEFGYHASVKVEKSPNVFIPGIPRADPCEAQYIDLEKHQLALLNLAIMAETFCWPKLFNVATEACIRGEGRLQRRITLDFIDRIYARTHDDSTLRAYALDSLSQMKAEGVEDLTPYMELAHRYSDFLADLYKVFGSSTPKDVTDKTIENYMFGNGVDRGEEEEQL